jgi:hypothetical protein
MSPLTRLKTREYPRGKAMDTAALQALLAKQEITEILYRYCRAFDRIDDDLARSVWHANGTCNYSNRTDGPDMLFRDYLAPSTVTRAKFRNHSHQVTNILIELDGDSAASEAYFTASLQAQPKNGVITEHLYRGRYLDRWARREGRWAIDHRQVIFDSYTPIDFNVARLTGINLELTRRDRQDPSYLYLSF